MKSVTISPPLPPYRQYADVFEAREERQLYDWAIANRLRFAPAPTAGGVNLARRESQRLIDMGPARSWFEAKIRRLAPDLFAETGTRPFAIEFIELEIAAHGDGAHFAVHTDMPIGGGRKPLGGDDTGTQDRLLSAVYYFYREPKGFTGGELRLHRFGSNGEPGDYVDIVPERNSLVAFPSWVTHEVLPIHCPSRDFPAYRFAVNCWLCKTLAWPD